MPPARKAGEYEIERLNVILDDQQVQRGHQRQGVEVADAPTA
jgi:hypothetical protein